MLLFGGHETTRNLIGNGINTLLRNPRRMSVTPAKIQIRVPAANPIIGANAPAQYAVLLHPHYPRHKHVPWESPPEPRRLPLL